MRTINSDWKIRKDGNRKRLHEGFLKFKQALEQDEKEWREKGSGLPKNWRERILK